ncbi:MAG: DUF881 domain-containing protein [Thermoanaerobacteraceae bacterium]|nr:DUF881 domain-containing protein [Thermoanaerobacteraceae bacterium]
MKRFYTSLVLICFLSGLLVSWQFRSHMAGSAETQKDTGLVDIIKALDDENTALQNQIGSLRQELEETREQHTRYQGQLREIQDQIDELKVLAGLVPLGGPGIVVTLDDNNAGAQLAKTGSPATYNPEDYIIHDRHILYLVNELKAAGAEGIAINGERLITGSHIRCVGTVILVNSTRLAPPYEIQAVGNPDRLEAAALRAPEFVDLKNRDFPVKVVKVEHLVLPAYKGGLPSDHMRPVTAGVN